MAEGTSKIAFCAMSPDVGFLYIARHPRWARASNVLI